MNHNIPPKIFLLFCLSTLTVVSCMKPVSSTKSEVMIVRENPLEGTKRAKNVRDNTPIQIADGLNISLWASDSLAPDPIAMSIDDFGKVFITRSNRARNSEFDIRGHRNWMTASIGLQTVEERRAFLHKTFAPEKSKENEWLKDLNEDGIHDWHDLAVEKDEIWRIEDLNNDGLADVSTRILNDFNTEVSDVAGGLLVRRNDAFVNIAPDMWRLKDTNGDGIYDEKKSISTGYQVHIGFGGHGMSGATEGPDGKIYWQIGDIGANITALDGKKYSYPNSGVLVRSNPDGSNFEVVVSGIRNTHEFVFDEYGNIISSDNDGDHPGESERLVHLVEGGDLGWRSNWQYGKYTDPKNNQYKVWMDEKLFKPRWDGQAAYIIPPIMNYHNGPTGMQYNPGTALGSVWKNKFFLVEFVGSPSGSHIWSFGLKPKGASFVLDGEKDMVSGILPTAIKFGPDGALYAGDWLTGWDVKNIGRVWKIDVNSDKNDLQTQREETKRLMAMDYTSQTDGQLLTLLAYQDMRIRQKAQFELANRGKKSLAIFQKAIAQTDNQLERIHGIWGVGQLAADDKSIASNLVNLLTDKDPEIIAQAAKVIGDVEYAEAGKNLTDLLLPNNPRIQFYAAQAIGRIKHEAAVPTLLKMLENNNDADLYIRHAGVLALSRIGQIEPTINLVNNDNKALRTAAVLVLRRLNSEKIALFLNDKDEYIVTEAARAINDDLSILPALPSLAYLLSDTKFSGEPLIRRAINACLRVGDEKALDILIAYSERSDISDALRAEALATIGSWANPSVLDRVDGRYRGELIRDAAVVNAKIRAKIKPFLVNENPAVLVSTAKLLGELNIPDYNEDLAKLALENPKPEVRSVAISNLSVLKYKEMEKIIKSGMNDKDKNVRTTSIGLLNQLSISKDNLPEVVKPIFANGSVQEQQQLIIVLGAMPIDNTRVVLDDLITKMIAETLSNKVKLDLMETVEKTKDVALLARMEDLKAKGSETDAFKEALFGGNFNQGRNIVKWNQTAQCIRCHSIGEEGGNVGPSLKKIGSLLTREQILQSLIEPSARLSPGFGTVYLKLKDGQEVTGILTSENEHELVLKTSEAEPLKIAVSRVDKRENYPSSMPSMSTLLSKREIRDVVEFLAGMK
ncbi:MAG: c-type cytochrome [Arcicella sp.]|nr:c-type cytochrome [Arcicella sp.]